MNNKISLIFLLSTSLYIFFAPICTGFDIYTFKKTSIALMLFSLILVIIQNNIYGIKKKDFIFFISFPILIFIYLSVWDNYKELNLIISIIIGYYLSKDEERFKKFLFIIFIIQFILVIYEFMHGSYIYDKVIIGLESTNESKIDISSYGAVGFRPKGLFYGTLEASSFSIILSMIFRKKLFLLFLILLMSILVNGRLAIIIVTFIFVITLYMELFKLKISKYLKLLLTYLPIILTSGLFYVFLSLLSTDAIENLMNVTNVESTSNYARILYSLQGIEEYLNYDLIHLLFGDSGAFNLEYGHSAESGWVNELLNIGLVGFIIYFATVVTLIYKSIYYNENLILLTVVFIFLSLTIYRFETGYLRGVLLWFYIFSIFKYFNVKRYRRSKNKGFCSVDY
jgi:hypothetical protein